ncbi:MAG: GH25 family lysozyme [Patescibacteria group bacterium]
MSFRKYWKQALGLLILIIGIFGILVYTRIIWFVYPNRNTYPIRGIDVSRYQGNIDWNKVKNDDVGFVYVKATEADDLVDAQFKTNTENAKQVGIKVGAYHFYSLRYGGEIQAKNFIATVSTFSIDLAPVIDLEYVGNSKLRPGKEDFQKELHVYIDMIKNQYGVEPVLYTTYEFYDDYLYPEFQMQPIWIRDVFSKPNANIKNWVMWQYNPYGKVEGIEGPVDLNVMRGM